MNEPGAKPVIAPAKNGPLIVKGLTGRLGSPHKSRL